MTILKNIHSTAEDYQQLTEFYAVYKDEWFSSIHVSLKQWFSANMSAPLGALLDLLQENVNDVAFDDIDQDIKVILQKNQFLTHFGYPAQRDNHTTTISYQKIKPEDSRYFHHYVQTQLFGRPELPVMSDSLRRKMTEAVFELFVNAQIHSKTTHIYTCGQFFPKKGEIEFCIVDTGIGIQGSISSRFKRDLPPIAAILWAVQDRNTTKIGVSGGIGLALLHEFVQKNKGSIQIVSGQGFYQYDESGEQTQLLTAPFMGTIVNVRFRTNDTNNYALASEAEDDDLF